MFNRKRVAVIALAIVVPLLAPSIVSAANGPQITCTGDTVVTWPGTGYNVFDAVLVSNQPNQGYYAEIPLAVDMPAGTYDLTGASYDGGDNRVDDDGAFQANEQYYVSFRDADGAEIARTGASPDLADDVEEDQWSGSFGTVVLDRPATQLVAVHAFPEIQDKPNSVQPICVGWSLRAAPTTTTTTTTEPPTEPPVDPPASSSTTSTTTTMVLSPPPSVSVTTTTTTTVPTRVLPEVQENPTPTPVPASPSFTG